MIRKLRITVLVDNASKRETLLSEHGLALWIDADGYHILFDTGQSDIIVENSRYMGIDLSAADALVISHGHYDHTGGVAHVFDVNRRVTVFCNSGIFIPRYSRQQDGSMRPVGITATASRALHEKIGSIRWIEEPTNIGKDIGITGPIPRTSAEDTGGSFFLDPEAQRFDLINDDLAVWFTTTKGIVVVTGCCHSGIIATVKHIQAITGETRIFALLGGLHLLHASPERLNITSEYLANAVIGEIYPCHCTGAHAIECLQVRLGKRINLSGVGTRLQLDT